MEPSTPTKSILPGAGLRDSGTRKSAAITPATVTGTLIRKTEPHQKWVSSRPPSTGPMATPMPTAEVQMPMARAPLARLEDVGDDGQRLRHDGRAAKAHHRAGRDELVGRVRVGGEQRAEAEQDQAGHEDPLAADPVADDAEGEQQAREDERVGVDRPLELGLAGADAALGRRAGDGLECDVEHGVVDDDGEQAHDQDAEDDPSPALNRLSIHEPLQGLGSVTRDRSK